jgi:hypothetical protein
MWFVVKGGWPQKTLLFLIMRCTSTVSLLIVLTLPPSYRCPLSTDYRPLGSCSRAAGWSAATLCHGTFRKCCDVRLESEIRTKEPQAILSSSSVRSLHPTDCHNAENYPARTSSIATSMFPRVAFEYGQIFSASSSSASATSRSTPGRLTLRRTRRK